MSLLTSIVIVSVIFKRRTIPSSERRAKLRQAFVVITAYLLGSIPFGYLVVRLREGGDIRQTGSGGTGATNVSRRAGKVAGVLTLFLDALKGMAAILLARLILGFSILAEGGHGGPPLDNAQWWIAGAAVAVILGHIFPIWLGFRGGKGVATGVGVFLMVVPLAVGLAAVIFVLIVWRTRYVSLGSITAAATIPVLVWLEDKFVRPRSDLASLLAASIVAALLIVVAHQANISRLLDGTESKFK